MCDFEVEVMEWGGEFGMFCIDFDVDVYMFRCRWICLIGIFFEVGVCLKGMSFVFILFGV